MIRACVMALALLASAACGKYGPPTRGAGEPSLVTPAVSAAPVPADTEECPDPNAPVPVTGQTP